MTTSRPVGAHAHVAQDAQLAQRHDGISGSVTCVEHVPDASTTPVGGRECVLRYQVAWGWARARLCISASRSPGARNARQLALRDVAGAGGRSSVASVQAHRSPGVPVGLQLRSRHVPLPASASARRGWSRTPACRASGGQRSLARGVRFVGAVTQAHQPVARVAQVVAHLP
jgi:hypothetical protein